MTLNQLENTAESVDIDELNVAAASLDLCGVYSKARKVLEMLSNFPGKLGLIIKALIAVLDNLCPQE